MYDGHLCCHPTIREGSGNPTDHLLVPDYPSGWANPSCYSRQEEWSNSDSVLQLIQQEEVTDYCLNSPFLPSNRVPHPRSIPSESHYAVWWFHE